MKRECHKKESEGGESGRGGIDMASYKCKWRSSSNKREGERRSIGLQEASLCLGGDHIGWLRFWHLARGIMKTTWIDRLRDRFGIASIELDFVCLLVLKILLPCIRLDYCTVAIRLISSYFHQ